MFSLFRSNHPATIILLFFYALLLKFQFFFERPFADYYNLSPLTSGFFWITNQLFNNSHLANTIIAFLLIFIQALLFNRIINKYRFFSRETYLSAFVYILMTTMFFELSQLTPVLLSSTCLLFVLEKIFNLYKKEYCYKEAFDIGLFVGIGSLFYLPVILYILILYIGLAILRSFIWREWVIGFIGLLIPYMITGCYYYWNDQFITFITNHFISNFEPFIFKIVVNKEMIIKFSIILFILVWSFFLFRANYLKSGIQTQKFSVILNFYLLIGLCSIFLQKELWISHIVLLIIPISCFAAYYFHDSKNKIVAEILHIGMIILILYYQYGRYFY